MSCALSVKNEIVKPLIFKLGFFSFMQLRLELEVSRRTTHFSLKCFHSVLCPPGPRSH